MVVMPPLQRIPASQLVAMDTYLPDYPITIDLVYADGGHPRNIFREQIYRSGARLWLYRDLAEIVLKAACILNETTGWTLELKDGLRPVEAQKKMQETAIVQANPHWCEEPGRLLSPPGKGGHPRGMAIDVICRDSSGREIDMGTPFDYLTEDRACNPAARAFSGFSQEILGHRQRLEAAMLEAAAVCGHDLLPLPSEWWDFRFPREVYDLFAPVSDSDLPEDMRMTA